MANTRLEEVCKHLRLSHLLRSLNEFPFETKEEWLLSLLENELRTNSGCKVVHFYFAILCIKVLQNTPIMSIIKRIEEIVGWISLSDFYDV